MTQGKQSLRNKTHADTVLAGPPHRRREHGILRYARGGLLTLIVGISILTSSPPARAEDGSPMLLSQMIAQQGDQLASIDSDGSAQALFTATIGPALGLKDAAGAVGAKRLSSKLVKELGVIELSQSVSELMAALAVWQFADSISPDDTRSPSSASLSTTKQDWIQSRSKVESVSELFRLGQADQSTGTAQATAPPKTTEILLAANRTALEASQKATAAWWDIYGWKDRIRQAKGRARLCGTWQWTIHNHQHHDEQKITLVFPPAGQVPANIPALSEMIILRDSIYLRWEQNGHIQEDSLLFIKDNTKIEGSFVNSTGGWGSITGKRTAACKP